MVDRKRGTVSLARVLRLFAVLALLFTSWQTVVASPTAQEAANGESWSMGISARTVVDQGHYDYTVGAHFTVTTEDGEYIDECTLAEPPDTGILWYCRVDVPSDRISLVWEDLDSIPAGYAPVENPIAFDPTTYETGPHNIGAFFDNVSTGGTENAASGQTANVAIWTKDNGENAYDACYVLVDFSDEGCDENGDGKVTFMEVPVGTYTVHQTADLGPNRSIPDFTIQVTGGTSSDGWESFTAVVISTGSSSSGPEIRGAGAPPAPSSTDISLITRDPDDGQLLTGTCYVLVGYGNEGCDENGDGQVTFDDVTAGTYTVRQTQTPGGYPTINDYDIDVQPRFPDVPIGFIVKQAPKQNAPGTRNVSVVLVDSRTFTKVVSPICVQIGKVSDVGCDEDLVDGQIDFLDVEFGTHDLRFSNLPSGWQILGEGQSGSSLTIESGTGPQIAYIAIYVPDGEGAGSSAQGNVEMRDMQISAVACTTADPASIQAGRNAADGTCYWDIGATFTVTTERGDTIGSCTLAGDRNAEIRIAGNVNCRVPVPIGVRVIITEDVNTITPGTAPRENPLDYTWPTNPQSVASYMGVGFLNVPTDGSTITGNGEPASGAADSSSSTVSSEETWSAPVVVWLCEDPAASVLDCRGEAGITVNIHLTSGEFMGSCTTGDPTATPWGKASFCVVNDLPFNGNFVATQDPSTIPNGYVPAEEAIELQVGSVNPVGFESIAFGFRNNRATAASIDPSSGTSSGSVIDDFIVGCVPAEACYNATITLSTQDGQIITSFTCLPPPSPVSSWICLVPNVPRGITVVITIDNVAPGYAVEQNPVYWDTTIEPTAGPVGNRPIFRFDTTGGSTSVSAGASNESATLLMTFRGCPEWFDPATDDFYANCTIPLDAPDASIIVWGGDGQGGMSITAVDRQYDGAYVYTAGPGTMTLQLSGLAPVVRDGYQVFGADGASGETYTVNLVDGETREVVVFYYFE